MSVEFFEGIFVDFSALVDVSHRVAATRSRLKKREYLSSLLRSLSPDELLIAVSYLMGELPQGKIGVGGAALRAALAAAPNNDTPTPIGIVEVENRLREIAVISGSGSKARRHELLVRLLESMNASQREFLCRVIVGDVRQGALEGVLVEAIADAFEVPKDDVQRAVMFAGGASQVAVVAQGQGITGVRAITLQLFRPLQPMLAETAEDPKAAIEQLGEAVFDYKLDGVRVQIHKDGDDVRLFSRHLNDITVNTPEIVEQVRGFACERLVLDGEVLALRANGRPHPFQTTMKRFARKQDMDRLVDELPLTLSVFDCLLFDDQLVMDSSLVERTTAMNERLPGESLVPRLITSDIAAAGEFFAKATTAGHEGVMAKSSEGTYVAGARGQSWLKIKPTHTLDLVVLAAEWGSGRRKGWLSNLHLGARDPSTGGFAMLGKTFKGLTDETLAWQTERLLQLEREREDYVVHVHPILVVEVAFNEVQQSRNYASGFALRFARVKRYRIDKTADEADTISQVEAIFRAHRE